MNKKTLFKGLLGLCLLPFGAGAIAIGATITPVLGLALPIGSLLGAAWAITKLKDR